MDNMPLNVVILGSIPESMLIIAFGLIMLGIKPIWRKIIVAAILQGIASYFIRRYISFGQHLLYLYITIIIFTWLIVKIPLITSMISSFIGMVINVLVEGLYSVIVLGLANLSLVEVLSRSWLRLLVFTPKLLIMSGLLYLCRKHRFSLEKELKAITKLNNTLK
ncbi:hypothetical protein F8154_11790 [Alkaliphilus pronyensis]|uniref:Uncharacterized protein n=1 Tax=Alkaliphilus pronyensis TaxID=1482732 RepID=A0A6I0F2T4_9FIRM|nr:hypothetical protein [Alkaliphilus pronyensis]KAB3532420.1 hypothetical protein F8154_11790 [Alkaliphilus pronyensis]